MIERGLKGVAPVVGDRCADLVSTVNSMLPRAKYQRCMVHFMRNVLSKVPPRPPGLGVRGPWKGDIRHGVPRIRPQGRDGRRGDGVQEAQGGGRLPARGHRGRRPPTFCRNSDEHCRICTNNMIERPNRRSGVARASSAVSWTATALMLMSVCQNRCETPRTNGRAEVSLDDRFDDNLEEN